MPLEQPPVVPPAPALEPGQGSFVFFSYAHRDKWLRDRLEAHLSNLKYRGLITTWYDREIGAGEEWARQIDIYLNKAHIILLLISADFMASQYCYSVEMKQALERHERREADVIPILLRPVLYTDAPFAKLQMLPTNGRPVIRWRDRDSAFFDIACGIERVAQKYSAQLYVDQLTPIPPPEYYGSIAVALPQQQYPEPVSQMSKGRHLGRLPIGVGVFVVGLIGVGVFVVGLIVAGILALIQNPTLIPFVISLFVYILFAGACIVVVCVVIRDAIRARSEQRRAQEAREAARRHDEAREAARRHDEEAIEARRRAQEAREAARKQRYYEEAIEAYQFALSRNPSDGDAYRGMGNALYALEYYDQALDAFTRAIDCDSTPATYAGLGDVFARLKRYSEAEAAYEKAIELDPTVTLNYDDFIQSLWALGRKEEAEQVHALAKQLGYEDEE